MVATYGTRPDSWAGAVMQKLLRIKKCDGWIDGPTDISIDTARCRVACPRLKIAQTMITYTKNLANKLLLILPAVFQL